MSNLLKQIISFSLPVTVLILVPLWIEPNRTIHVRFSLILAILFIAIGLAVMFVTISSFIKIGKGTLAPWTPTKRLVIAGPYKYVRNPMIMAVLVILLGEALALRSQNILIWAGTFFVVNTIYFILFEEPNLEQRFGNDYQEYKRNVSRWLPRLTPYQLKRK